MCGDQHQWQRNVFRHSFNACRQTPREDRMSVKKKFKTWLRDHQGPKIMLASIIVVVGLWRLFGAMLAHVINLIGPLLVVLLAVASVFINAYLITLFFYYKVCMPQLSALYFPAVAKLLRTILFKLADNIAQD